MTNKEIVLKFYEEVFNQWDVSNIDDYMLDSYIQHNPACENGKAGFLKFAEMFLAMKPQVEVVKAAEDGDMVFVFFKCTMGNGSVNKVCDIYRLEDGKLAEHWDVVDHNVQEIVPVNQNGLF